MRLFAAIELPEATLTVLHAFTAKLRNKSAGATWVKPGNLHLTLRFYGEVSEKNATALSNCLTEHLAPLEAPELLARGVGAFPSIRKPSILWVGIETLSGDLSGLQCATEQAALDTGLAPETRPFHPHLTLARLRKGADASLYANLLRPYLEPGLAPEFGPAFRADKITLFSSLLTQRGTIYTIVREITLK